MMKIASKDSLQRVSGVVFDLDGTLLDTMTQWNSLGVDYLRQLGYEPRADTIDKIGAMSLRECVAYFKSEYKIERIIETMLSELHERLSHLYSDEAREKPGAVDTLRLLKKHAVKVAVATATSRELAIAGLSRVGALEYVDHVLSCRDADIKAHKDQPKIYEEAQRRLGVLQEETVVVEDAFYAILTAKRAGYYVVGIEDESERSRKEKIVRTVDLYCTDHEQIQQWLQTQLEPKS